MNEQIKKEELYLETKRAKDEAVYKVSVCLSSVALQGPALTLVLPKGANRSCECCQIGNFAFETANSEYRGYKQCDRARLIHTHAQWGIGLAKCQYANSEYGVDLVRCNSQAKEGLQGD